MATWTSMGHAMRRRMGAPTNHHEAAGKSMSKDLTPEQITATGARAYMCTVSHHCKNARTN